MTNLEKFRFYLKDLESPSHFIDWNFYYSIAAAMGRKVWISGGDFPIFTNLYIIFVGPPAAGKSLPARQTSNILKSLKSATVDEASGKVTLSDMIKTAPDSITLEALYKTLAQATQQVKHQPVPGQSPTYYSHASVAFCIGDELSTLFKEKSNDLINFMTQGYDCGDFIRETKTAGTDVIKFMCINLLGCCTQDWIRRNIDASAVEGGFTSRVLFIYGDEPRHRILFINTTDEQKAARTDFQEHLKKVTKLFGEAKLSPDAHAYLNEWVQKQDNLRLNKDPKMAHYYGRKKIHSIKLAAAVHFGESLDMTISLNAVETAMKLLASAEVNMHKALASSGRNELADLAGEILASIRKLNGFATKARILMDHWGNGREPEINECLQFLVETKQIKNGVKDGKAGYQLEDLTQGN